MISRTGLVQHSSPSELTKRSCQAATAYIPQTKIDAFRLRIVAPIKTSALQLLFPHSTLLLLTHYHY